MLLLLQGGSEGADVREMATAATRLTRMPAANGLPFDVWTRRHAHIRSVLLAHVPVLVGIGLLRGIGLLHIAVDVVPALACTLLASLTWFTPRLRSLAAAFGLMAAAAAFVHLTAGRTEAHFLFFVLLGVLSLYDDWLPYAAAVGFVLVEHGVVGAFWPQTLYTDAASGNPWLWAGIHGGFVLAASVVALVSWRWREADRAEADDRLRTSEDHFRVTFEVAPIGIALVAPDGRFLQVNRALGVMLGYDSDELAATTFQAITHPEDLDLDLHNVERCLEGAIDGYVMEKRYLHRDGHEVWAELNVALVRDPSGRPAHFISQILDITERRAVAASEARFSAMVEHGSDVISITDPTGRFTYASPSFGTVLGYASTEVIGRPLEEYVHPDDRSAVSIALSGLLPGGSIALRFQHRHASGTWRWVDATLTNRVEDPAVNGFVVNTHDVTDQVHAHERLAHQATHDALTGLANRTLLHERLAQACSAANRRGEMLAALYVDIDHFKDINDTYGHGVGDRLLEEVAARLRESARLDDTIARVGGDEFVVIASVHEHDSATDLADRFCDAMRRPFPIDDAVIRVSASVGVATLSGATDGVDLLAAADSALYEAKARGRDCWVARNAAPVVPMAPRHSMPIG